MTTMMQNVGAAILLAQAGWNPKTASEPLERVMAQAALEAMMEPTLPMMQAAHAQRREEKGIRDIFRAAIQAALDEE